MFKLKQPIRVLVCFISIACFNAAPISAVGDQPPTSYANNAILFDSWLRQRGVGADIYLPAGTWETMGTYLYPHYGMGFEVKDGWHVHGDVDSSGNPTTTLKLVDAYSDGINDVNYVIGSDPVNFTHKNNVIIENMVIDCGFDYEQSTLKIGGVHLFGSGNTLRNLRVINAINELSDDELFVVSVGGMNTATSGILVDRVLVESFRGNGACSGIALNGSSSTATTSGTVQYCDVRLNSGAAQFGYVVAWSGGNGVRFFHNTSLYCCRGINNDSGQNYSLRIDNNWFLCSGHSNGCGTGAYIASSYGTILEDNLITLIPSSNLANGNIGIISLPPCTINGHPVNGAFNCIFRNNYILGNGTAPYNINQAFYTQNLGVWSEGNTIQYNTIWDALSSTVTNLNNNVISPGNKKSDGTPATGFPSPQ